MLETIKVELFLRKGVVRDEKNTKIYVYVQPVNLVVLTLNQLGSDSDDLFKSSIALKSFGSDLESVQIPLETTWKLTRKQL